MDLVVVRQEVETVLLLVQHKEIMVELETMHLITKVVVEEDLLL